MSIQTTFQNLPIVRYALIKNGFAHEIVFQRVGIEPTTPYKVSIVSFNFQGKYNSVWNLHTKKRMG